MCGLLPEATGFLAICWQTCGGTGLRERPCHEFNSVGVYREREGWWLCWHQQQLSNGHGERHENGEAKAIQNPVTGVKLAAGANSELIHSGLGNVAAGQGYISDLITPCLSSFLSAFSFSACFVFLSRSVFFLPTRPSSFPTCTLKQFSRS